MAIFLGIDGGGTHTEACLIDSEGRVLGKGSGGPSNLFYAEEKVFVGSVSDAVQGALREAGLQIADIAMACAGLAGAGGPASIAKAEGLLNPLFGATPFIVVGDTMSALAAAHGGGNGVILIAGTGSNCMGVKDGTYAMSGGWGSLLGDEGSAYSIAVKGLRIAAKSSDGRSKPTSMLDLFLGALGGKGPRDLISLTRNLDRPGIAGLARAVFDAASAGDEAALGILDEEAAELALMVLAVSARLGLDEVRLGLVGGCFKSAAYVRSLRRALSARTAGPAVEIVEGVRPPGEGAAILARAKWRR